MSSLYSKNNTNATYTKNSRYTYGGTTEVDGSFIQWWERKKISQDPSDFIYTLEKIYEGRPDMLASVLYNDSSLWWVILQFNNILDLETEFIEGTILRLPTAERIQNSILVGSTGGIASTAVNPPAILPIVH